jgi:methionyl-tRNA synthetase
MSAGIEPPKRVFAHGWWTIEGQKMSKSLGNAIPPHVLIERYGVDQARYFLLREVPFGNDGNFSHEAAVNRINSDLANGLGNLSQRTLSMIYKNCEERLPEANDLTDEDNKLLQEAYVKLLPSLRIALDQQKFHTALEEIMKLVGEADSYIDRQAPWKLKKEDPERMHTVLYVLAEVIRCLSISMQPFTPNCAALILDQLQVDKAHRDFTYIGETGKLAGGTSIEKPAGVFPRILDEEQQQAIA